MAKIEIIQVKNNQFLFLDDYLWVWNLPQEQELQRDIANLAFGDVLVAGYGFGIVNKYLLGNPRVSSVITVEKYKEVIDKMRELGKIHGEVVIGDFYELTEDKKYDCVVGDIWAEIDRRFLCDYRRGFTEVAIPPKISPRFLRHPTKIRAEKFLRAGLTFGNFTS